MRFDKFKVKNSEAFVNHVITANLLGRDHRLSSWDYDSMFTNIPFQFAKRIIIENYDAISEETFVPVELFIDAISLLIEDSCYFVFKDEIYKQLEGLTMGGRLSQMLADICTNYATMKAIEKINVDDISFLFKYADDFSGAMSLDVIKLFESELTKPMV